MAAIPSILLALAAVVLGAAPVSSREPGRVRWGALPCADSTIERVLARAYDLVYERDFETAKSYYEVALTLDSTCAEAFAGLGLTHRYLRNDQAAFEASARALKLDSLAFAARWNYGELHWPWRGTTLPDSLTDRDRIHESIRHLERAARANHPSAGHARISLWTAYMGLCDLPHARDQLHRMKAEHYFPTVVLDHAYNVLVGLDRNAILITSGDMDTYPLAYVQEVDGFRRDVRIVNTSLVRNRELLMCMRDSLGISLPPSLWVDAIHTIDPDNALNKIVENAWDHRQPVYVSISVGSEPHVEEHGVLEGLVWRLDRDTGGRDFNINKIVSNMNTRYRLDFPTALPEWKTNLSPVTRSFQLLTNYVMLYFVMARDFRERGNTKDAITCCRAAVRLCRLLGHEAGVMDAVQLWLEIEPRSAEARAVLNGRSATPSAQP